MFRPLNKSDKHLSTDYSVPNLVLITSLKLPYHNLGFSLVEFTSFHFRLSPYSSLRHFIKKKSYSRNLDFFLVVRIIYLRLFFFPKHEHYRHHSLCEHGLSSALQTHNNMWENRVCQILFITIIILVIIIFVVTSSISLTYSIY